MKVNSIMLLKINGGKMSDSSLSMILMKTNELKHPLHDVDEKKRTCRKPEIEMGDRTTPGDCRCHHFIRHADAIPLTTGPSRRGPLNGFHPALGPHGLRWRSRSDLFQEPNPLVTSSRGVLSCTVSAL